MNARSGVSSSRLPVVLCELTGVLVEVAGGLAGVPSQIGVKSAWVPSQIGGELARELLLVSVER